MFRCYVDRQVKLVDKSLSRSGLHRCHGRSTQTCGAEASGKVGHRRGSNHTQIIPETGGIESASQFAQMAGRHGRVKVVLKVVEHPERNT